MWFPSPHGDKFQPIRRVIREEIVDTFPSPHGDKFQQRTNDVFGKGNGFRPLTGINFNDSSSFTSLTNKSFPSPHGDKFQRQICDFCLFRRAFPSPHGDKFQRRRFTTILSKWETFPSPHGDKFQPCARLRNGNITVVSVPSRG